MSATTNLVPTTELEAVNICLYAIGEAPVATVSVTGLADAQGALQKLREASRAFQAHGWSFNREGEVLIARSIEGWINKPSDALEFDISRAEGRHGVVRGTRLFDTDKNTFVWDRDLKCDIIRFLSFEDLPETARYFIAVRAARLFARGALGSMDSERFTADDELRALILFKRGEARAADRNIFRNNPLLDRSSDILMIPGRGYTR
jgi:hypothetical protein